MRGMLYREMKSHAGWLVLASVACTVFAMWSAHKAAAQRRMSIAAIRVYTAPNGKSRAEQTELKMGPSTLREGLVESEALKLSNARFIGSPSGYVWDWHPAPERQYVIVIRGRAEIETGDGQKTQVDPGGIVLAEDLTGRGHITRSTGAEDFVALVVPLGK